jgi:hypothetical protein
MDFKFAGYLAKEKIIIISLLASLKTVTNSKDQFESRVIISVPAFFVVVVKFSPVCMS